MLCCSQHPRPIPVSSIPGGFPGCGSAGSVRLGRLSGTRAAALPLPEQGQAGGRQRGSAGAVGLTAGLLQPQAAQGSQATSIHSPFLGGRCH